MCTNSSANSKETTLKSGSLAHRLTDEERRRGGMRRSSRKTLANVLKGLEKKKGLTKQQKFYLACLKDNKIIDLIMGMLAEIVLEANTFEKKIKILDQVSKLLPKEPFEPAEDITVSWGSKK